MEATPIPLSPAAAAAAGAVASLASKALTHPIDTVKAQLQLQGAVGGTARASAAGVARQILASDGPRGLYRGLGAVVLGAGPASAVYFAAAETARAALPALGLPPAAVGPLAGVAAQLAAGVAFTPVDIVKERLQATRVTGGGGGTGTSAVAAVAAALRSGGPASLLRGYWVTNAVWLPWSALYFGGYERLRGWAVARERGEGVGTDAPLSAPTQLAVGAAAAAAASLATHPLDVVKTRCQVLSAGDQTMTAARAAALAWRNEGARAFAAGAGARAAQLAAATGLQWLVYERLRGGR